MFKFANDELKKIAEELFNKHKTDLNLTVHPDKVVFMRSDKKKNAYAYCQLIHGPYELMMPDKKFFIVIVSENFDELATQEEKEWVLLHELTHLHYDQDKDKFNLRKHDIQDFHELLVDPKWNLRLTMKKTETKLAVDSVQHFEMLPKKVEV